jgi:PTS system nitrogen regulatory IIA component
LFARLDRPIDFESLDGQPVDLVFLLLARKARAPTISRRWPASRACWRDPDIAHKLRESNDSEALYAVLTMTPSAAA